MDLNSPKTSRWVSDRLGSLEPPQSWMPDAARALARLRELERAGRARRLRWIWASSVTTVAAGICVTVLLSPQACANPRVCAESVWNVVRLKPAITASAPIPVPAAAQAPAPAPATAPAKPAPKPAPAPLTNFKEFGPTMAAVTIELYSDYQCPACAQLHRDILPHLMARYVKTGKIRLIVRDFPLPMHPYARLAARYANAAGRLGFFEAAAGRIFETQASWSMNGAIDAQLAPVLPPAILQQVRASAASDASLDQTVEADVAAGRTDQLNQTPSLVVVHGGKRQLIPGAPPFELLKRYLDGLLAR